MILPRLRCAVSSIDPIVFEWYIGAQSSVEGRGGITSVPEGRERYSKRREIYCTLIIDTLIMIIINYIQSQKYRISDLRNFALVFLDSSFLSFFFSFYLFKSFSPLVFISILSIHARLDWHFNFGPDICAVQMGWSLQFSSFYYTVISTDWISVSPRCDVLVLFFFLFVFLLFMSYLFIAMPDSSLDRMAICVSNALTMPVCNCDYYDFFPLDRFVIHFV